jgi:hypothetical protein
MNSDVLRKLAHIEEFITIFSIIKNVKCIVLNKIVTDINISADGGPNSPSANA